MSLHNRKQDYILPTQMINEFNYESTSGCLSKLFYIWFNKFISTARHKTTDEIEELIWDLDDSNKSHNLFKRFENNYKKEPKIWKALLQTFRRVLWYTSFLRIVHIIAITYCPQILK